MSEEETNWHKVMLATALTVSGLGTTLLTAAVALAKDDAAFPLKMVGGGIVLIILGGFGLFLTRPSQTSAKLQKLADAIPGDPSQKAPPMFPPEPPAA